MDKMIWRDKYLGFLSNIKDEPGYRLLINGLFLMMFLLLALNLFDKLTKGNGDFGTILAFLIVVSITSYLLWFINSIKPIEIYSDYLMINGKKIEFKKIKKFEIRKSVRLFSKLYNPEIFIQTIDESSISIVYDQTGLKAALTSVGCKFIEI
ncbi:hypothetical protein HY989_04585 [Candidatus Micrarchaeota archaeon]|nr:hypothetical protein [Candidatus Micrarchaeota archaeon]